MNDYLAMAKALLAGGRMSATEKTEHNRFKPEGDDQVQPVPQIGDTAQDHANPATDHGQRDYEKNEINEESRYDVTKSASFRHGRSHVGGHYADQNAASTSTKVETAVEEVSARPVLRLPLGVFRQQQRPERPEGVFVPGQEPAHCPVCCGTVWRLREDGVTCNTCHPLPIR